MASFAIKAAISAACIAAVRRYLLPRLDIFPLPFLSPLSLSLTSSPATGKKTTYRTIYVALAPSGEISVWLGGDGLILEVASLQAEEVDIDWSNINNNPDITRKDYVQGGLERRLSKEQLSFLQKTGIPKGLYKNTYREKYNWKPESTGLCKIRVMWIVTFNGEAEHIDFTVTPQAKELNRAIPKHIMAGWTSAAGEGWARWIWFDEQETFKAFHEFQEKNLKAGKETELTLEIEFDSEYIKKVFLKDKNTGDLLELKNIEIHLYQYR